MQPPNPRTDQDVLRDCQTAGDYINAESFLRHLTQRDRNTERRYPDPRTKKKPQSSDWQITRSHAADALRSGCIEPHSLLAMHIHDAFTMRDGETIEDRQARAVEVFDACLDAAKKLTEVTDIRNFFILVDAAADHAVASIGRGTFPTKMQVETATVKSTGIRGTEVAEWTKIFRHARLSFLEKGKQHRRI